MRSRKGLLITFEKTADGLGGTTQCSRLYENLKKLGIETVRTREPGGTPLGQKLRELLLHPETKLAKPTELFLMLADRSQHYLEVLKPSLKQGKVVVCDRFFDSTLVYQGSAQGWKTAFLLQLHHAATGMLIPDLTIVLDGVPHRPLDGTDNFESKGAEFYRKVKEGMLHFASKDKRYVILNANQSEDELAGQILSIVKERFPQHFTKD